MAELIAGGMATLTDHAETVFTTSLIIYYLTSGFLVGYLVTRIKLHSILEKSH